MNFSRAQSKVTAVQIKVRRAKTKARAQLTEFKTKHPDWCRDAAKGQYTQLITKITDDCQKQQIRNETFTKKLHQEGEK